MRKLKNRWFVYDASFIFVVMVAAMASAVLEAGAVLSGMSAIDAVPVARATPPKAERPATAASAVDGTPAVNVASRSSGR